MGCSDWKGSYKLPKRLLLSSCRKRSGRVSVSLDLIFSDLSYVLLPNKLSFLKFSIFKNTCQSEGASESVKKRQCLSTFVPTMQTLNNPSIRLYLVKVCLLVWFLFTEHAPSNNSLYCFACVFCIFQIIGDSFKQAY